MGEKLSINNQSLGKALQIIEFMAQYKRPARLQDIAEALAYPASTTLRFLATLEQYKYVKQNRETLKYSLTLKICKLGDLVSSSYNIRDVARPYLADLVEAVGESACLAIEENQCAVYLDVEPGPDNVLRVLQRIGREAPLHCTGVGKILLLNYDRPALEKLAAGKGLVQLTDHTITALEDLVIELEQVRKQRYALDQEECEIGARCIAAPIRDYTGKIVASISVSGPASRMTPGKIEQIRDKIVICAEKLSEELGY